jgi:hypothetical protein
MARRKTNAELEVRAAFEASRIAPQCLADAYERLVTVPAPSDAVDSSQRASTRSRRRPQPIAAEG